MEDSNGSSFSALPAELRLQVLRDLFTFAHPISLEDRHDAPWHWVWKCFEVNREFRTCGSRMFFGDNTFRLDIFSQTSLESLQLKAKRAEFVSIPGLNHSQEVHYIDYHVAIPLPASGTVRALRAIQLPANIYQRQHDNGWHGSKSACNIVRMGTAYQITNVQSPRQTWDARKLIRHVIIAAPKTINCFFWEELELACQMVEILTSKHFQSLESVVLDIKALIDFHGSFGIPLQLARSPVYFAVGAERFTVVGRRGREVDEDICQRVRGVADLDKVVIS